MTDDADAVGWQYVSKLSYSVARALAEWAREENDNAYELRAIEAQQHSAETSKRIRVMLGIEIEGQ